MTELCSPSTAGLSLARRNGFALSTVGRKFAILATYGCLLGGGWLAGSWGIRLAEIDVTATIASPDLMIAAALLLFVVTSALPFVPGAEIGVMLMICFGKPLVLPVYLCMVAALMIAFIAGRFVSLPVVSKGFALLGLSRAGDLVTGFANDCKRQYAGRLPPHRWGRFASLILRNRLLALILLFNVPGNSVAGGGGGIALAAGISRLYSIPVFLFAVLAAIAPVPVIFYLTM